MNRVRKVVDVVHSRGLSVFLRSKLLVDTGESPSNISPNDVDAWFSSYSTILNQVAQFSAEQGVSMLSIGSGLNLLEAPDFDPNWRDLVTDVRQAYAGELTYSANYLFDAQLGGGFEEVNWWDELDVIGINALFPLTFDQNAVAETLKANVAGEADIVEDFLRGADPSRVVFTDIGYRSVNGGAVLPEADDRGGDRIDLAEQALAYDAVLTELRSREWWGGAFWRGWQGNPHAGGAGDRGYTPQHKPAEGILAEHYGGSPTFVLRPSLLESWEDGFNGWRLPDAPVV